MENFKLKKVSPEKLLSCVIILTPILDNLDNMDFLGKIVKQEIDDLNASGSTDERLSLFCRTLELGKFLKKYSEDFFLKKTINMDNLLKVFSDFPFDVLDSGTHVYLGSPEITLEQFHDYLKNMK